MRTKIFKFPLRLSSLPETSGVYFFRSANRTVLYVGKAANVRERIRSYVTAKPGTKQYRLMQEARSLAVQPTRSDIEALVVESAAIKKLLPKYNVVLKDDKRYFSLCFVVHAANPGFPRVWITHQPSRYPSAHCIGPFVDGTILKRSLRMVRQYFPFCTCKGMHERMCLSAHLGLCPGFCCVKSMRPAAAHARAYAQTLASVGQIFLGQDQRLVRTLKRAIARFSSAQSYEEAARIKQQLEGLERIFSHQSVVEHSDGTNAFAPGLAWLKEKAGLHAVGKIETFDTSMLQGSHRVGAMIALEHGAFAPSLYRRFKIRQVDAKDDLSMLREMLERRLRHNEWEYPDALFMDGGIAQLNAALDVVRSQGLSITVCALEKDRTHRLASVLIAHGNKITLHPVGRLAHDVQRLFLECSERVHAYAIAYYRKTSRRSVGDILK